MHTLDCLHRHIFLLHVYRSVSLARMRRYMQLAYLLHQCAKSLLSRDSRIADCTEGSIPYILINLNLNKGSIPYIIMDMMTNNSA